MAEGKFQSNSQGAPTLAWLTFARIGLLFIAYGIYAFTLMDTQPTHWNFLTSDNRVVEYIGYTFKWLGILSLGFSIITIEVSVNGFRRGEKWAWDALVFFPVFSHLAIPFTWPGFMWLPFSFISSVSLFITRQAVFKD